MHVTTSIIPTKVYERTRLRQLRILASRRAGLFYYMVSMEAQSPEVVVGSMECNTSVSTGLLDSGMSLGPSKVPQQMLLMGLDGTQGQDLGRTVTILEVLTRMGDLPQLQDLTSRGRSI